jgi:nicotinamide mononucleotide transporter
MLSTLPDWLLKNWTEITGALLGVVYIYFSIRQNILTWPAGLLTSAFYIIVFLNSRFYAYTGLQIYYVVISIYGWIHWMKGKNRDDTDTLEVTRVSGKLILQLLIITCFINIVILFLLRLTDSPVPFTDSFITALSIVATWMLARKILENWLIWILADTVSVGLFIFQKLWATALLFLVYTVMAVSGYYKWKKSMTGNELT